MFHFYLKILFLVNYRLIDRIMIFLVWKPRKASELHKKGQQAFMELNRPVSQTSSFTYLVYSARRGFCVCMCVCVYGCVCVCVDVCVCAYTGCIDTGMTLYINITNIIESTICVHSNLLSTLYHTCHISSLTSHCNLSIIW